jgi:lipid-A-disaccharide synthase
LGASLVKALSQIDKDIRIEGIVGPKLLDLGAKSLFPMDRINVMGFIDPIKRLPELLKIRHSLIKHFIQNPPDVFIGIDAPDFNLNIETKLRKAGIKTVHYVSPTIWAWRAGRIKTVKKAVDLMLTIFPFETEVYQKAEIPVCFVGHPFADEIPLEIDELKAKESLGYKPNDIIIAVLPGSRNKELHYLLQPYLETLKLCYKNRPELKFIMPVVSLQHKQLAEKMHLEIAKELPLKIILGNARLAMSAAKVALVTSGSATLEVLLHKKPMVVGYKMHPFTYHIAKHLVKVPYIAMANIIAQEKLAPEFIQDDVNPIDMAKSLLALLEPLNSDPIIAKYKILHEKLALSASHTAANAITRLITKTYDNNENS